MRRKFQPDPTLPNYRPNVYDTDKIRFLYPSRNFPCVEAAAMMRTRRERDMRIFKATEGTFGADPMDIDQA